MDSSSQSSGYQANDDMSAIDDSVNQMGQIAEPSAGVDPGVVHPDGTSIDPPSIGMGGGTNLHDQPTDGPNFGSAESTFSSTPSVAPVDPAGSAIAGDFNPAAIDAADAANPTMSDIEDSILTDPVPAIDEPAITPTPPADNNTDDKPADDLANDANDEPDSDDETPQPVSSDSSDSGSDLDSDSKTDSSPSASKIASGDGTDDELFDVKNQALQELKPIVDTLELPPEERFETLMMIIRASDDKKLVKPAMDAAHDIEDKDKKARALLDVVNEVNYLTHAKPGEN